GVPSRSLCASQATPRPARKLSAAAGMSGGTAGSRARERGPAQGRDCPVVDDSVVAASCDISLACVAPRGARARVGNSSVAVTGVNLGQLAQKGSLYVTRPVLATDANARERRQAMADELFVLLESGQVQVEISQRYNLADAAK